MVKKRSLSNSEREGSFSSKRRNINTLLQNANISSRSELLKNELLKNGLQNISKETKTGSELRHRTKLNGKRKHESPLESNSSDDSDHEEFKSRRRMDHSLSSAKLNNKIKGRRREEVSSSSNEEHRSFNIKNEIVSGTEYESDSDKQTPNIILPKMQNRVTNLGSSADKKDFNILGRSGLNKSSLNSASKKIKKQKRSARNKSITPDSSDNEIRRLSVESNKVVSNSKLLGKNTGDDSNNTSNSSDDEMSSSHARLHDYEKTMENIERRIEKSNFNKPSKEKVNVLQNILITPPKQKPLKEKLEEVYPGIKLTKSNMTIELSNTEDIYLFRIPKNVDPSSLEYTDISLDTKCKIKIGKKYNIEPTPNIPSPTLIVANNSRIVNFKGDIQMEKYIKSSKDPNLTIPEVKPVPLPDNLKKRHPLFGSEYKQKIKLSEDVKQKVDNAIENLLKKEKAKKKKHKRVKQEQSEDDQNETIFTLLNSHSHVNKKIKNELTDNNPSTSRSSDVTNKLSSHFDGVNETLKRIKSEILTETESEHTDYISVKKKKKKNKHSYSQVEETNTNVKSEPTNIPERKNRLLANSTLIPNILKTPSFSPDVSRIKFDEPSSEKTPKKRKKKSSEDERSLIEKELISDILDSLKSDLTPSKKVKKKKYLSQ